VRRLFIVGYAVCGVVTLVGHADACVLIGAGVLVLRPLAAETLDGAGKHALPARGPSVRAQRDDGHLRSVSQTPPARCRPRSFAALLSAFELPAVFVAGGVMMLGMAALPATYAALLIRFRYLGRVASLR